MGPGCATGACFTDGVATTGSTLLIWEGVTADLNEFTFSVPSDPGADITWTVPNAAASLTFPSGTTTVAAYSDNLSVFAATTSAQLAGVLSDETGAGAAVFATSPTLTGTPQIGDGAGNDKLEFVEEATNPTCAAGDYFVWANSTDAKLKKCQNGTITDLDTTGGGGGGATHRIGILGWRTKPDTSGNVFFEPYTIKATNDQWDYEVLIFNDTATRDCVFGGFDIPQDYSAGAKVIIHWTATVTSGDVEWDFDYRAVGGDDLESLDQTGTQETVNINDTAPSAIHERMTATLSLTATNLAVGDTVQFKLCRDGTDAGDTLAAAAIVHDVLFEYTD